MYLNLRSLDALRGILAIYVLVGHARWLLWSGMSVWQESSHPLWCKLIVLASAGFRYGHEAVMIFFALSGFFIHLKSANSLVSNQPINLSLSQFLKRRLHRLAPPYFYALIFTFIIDYLGFHLYPTLYTATTGDPLLDANFSRKGYSLESVLPAILILPSSLGKDFGTNGPLWSLAYEIVYYLLYPFWLKVRTKFGFYVYPIILSLSLVFSIFPNSFISSVLAHYPIWLGGAALAELVIRFPSFKRLTKFIAPLTLAISFLALNLWSSPLLLISILIYIVFSCSVLLMFLALPKRVYLTQIHQAFEMLGLQSYTIYICHFPLITFISAWSINVLGERPLDGYLAIFGVLITLVWCRISFLLCESKFLHSRLKL